MSQKKGKHSSQKTEFKKGQIPWNKGRSGRESHTYGKHWKVKNTSNYGKNLIGKPSWNKGKKWSTEQRKKLTKEYSSNWKGGITPENERIRRTIEFRLWREAVFARDNFTCQKTKIKGDKLEAHHIKPFALFPELRFAIDNGITLSEKTHREFHKKYGRKNNNREQIDNFLVE